MTTNSKPDKDTNAIPPWQDKDGAWRQDRLPTVADFNTTSDKDTTLEETVDYSEFAHFLESCEEGKPSTFKSTTNAVTLYNQEAVAALIDQIIGDSLSYHSMNFDIIDSYDGAFTQGSQKTVTEQRKRANELLNPLTKREDK